MKFIYGYKKARKYGHIIIFAQGALQRELFNYTYSAEYSKYIYEYQKLDVFRHHNTVGTYYNFNVQYVPDPDSKYEKYCFRKTRHLYLTTRPVSIKKFPLENTSEALATLDKLLNLVAPYTEDIPDSTISRLQHLPDRFKNFTIIKK